MTIEEWDDSPPQYNVHFNGSHWVIYDDNGSRVRQTRTEASADKWIRYQNAGHIPHPWFRDRQRKSN
jgi:hypothetical protein